MRHETLTSHRIADRARAAAGKVERTKNMVLFYMLSRELKKIEGYQFTLRAQKNSQDSVRITDEAAVRSHIAGLMRGLMESAGIRCSRFFQTSFRDAWSRLFRRRDRTRTRSKRLRRLVNMSQGRKFAAVHI